MKFQLAINMERTTPDTNMRDVERHTLEMVQMADDGGFVIVWAAEHHALEMTIAPNPFQILTWWAAHTSRIRLGTGVVVAPYWHPVNVAGEAALLDLYSGGRLEFGIGSGFFLPDESTSPSFILLTETEETCDNPLNFFGLDSQINSTPSSSAFATSLAEPGIFFLSLL